MQKTRDIKSKWELVLEADFSKPSALENWKLEGSADVSIIDDGELLIETKNTEIQGREIGRSTLWYSEPIWGDLRFEFDSRNRFDFLFLIPRPCRVIKVSLIGDGL